MTTWDAMNEAEIEPVLKLFQGGDPDEIASKAKMSKEALLQRRDALIADAWQEGPRSAVAGTKKVGRNDPCPCGSGKKYKHCCLKRHEALRRLGAGSSPGTESDDAERLEKTQKEQQALIRLIQQAFEYLASRQYAKAISFASEQLSKYPNEDRLHDIVATSHLYAGDCDAAIRICEQRLKKAESEKAYFVKHGKYRDRQPDQPALSYYYPPLTWLQKYWTALKARDYQALYPTDENRDIVMLVKKLESADDPDRFPAKHSQGLELRKTALKETLDKLKQKGPETLPYLLPLACRYSWAGLFVPEILAGFETDAAIEALMDISMFGFAYASGASLHYLEKRGEAIIPHIEAAFKRDKAFDPIKTGIVSVLGNLKSPAAYALLTRLLAHESAHIVNWAGGALGKFEDPGALPAMMAANERIGREKMIDAAIEKLKDLRSEQER